MKRRTSLLATALLTVLCVALVLPFVAYAQTDQTYVSNDFNEQDFTVNNGYVVFNGNLQMFQDSNGLCKLWSDNGFNDTDGDPATITGTIYVYLDFSATWPNTQQGQCIEVELMNSTEGITELQIEQANDGNYEFGVKAGNEIFSTEVTTIPSQLILCYTGAWLIVYDTGDNVLASVQCNHGTAQTWTQYCFYTYYMGSSVTINGYSFATTLEDISTTGSMAGSTDMVLGFLPVIIVLAVLGMCLGMLKKMGKW